MAQHEVKFGTVAEDYALWRNDIPEQIFGDLKQRGLSFHNRRVVDVGCGSGVLCRALAARGAAVTGVDPARELLEQAKTFDTGAQARYDIKYLTGSAEHTGLQDGCCDVVTVLRAWHWFQRDKANAEVKRLLERGGHFAVLDSGFQPDGCEVAKQTLRLMRAHVPGRGLQAAGSKADAKEVKHGFPLEWFDEWNVAGFDLLDAWQFTYNVPFTHEGWRGRIRSLSAFSALDAQTRLTLDGVIADMLKKRFAHEQFFTVPHTFSAVLLRMPG